MFFPPEVILRPLAKTVCINGSKAVKDISSHSLLAANRCAAREQKRYYRAAVIKELNKPIVINNLPSVASLLDNEVRISIQAAGVNFGDLLRLKGTYQVKAPLPFTPGSEISGTVTEVGSNVRSLQPGSRVLSILPLGVGGFAEEEAFKIPKSMSFEDAASLLCSYGTAITALERKACIKRGETVLVTAAAGGVGLATVDLAKNVFGAKVIGAAGSEEKCQLVKSYGAEHALNYSTENIRDRIKQLTGNGANVIIDPVGGDVFTSCFRSLAPEGRLVVIGFASGKIPSIPANHLLVKNISVLGLYWGGQAVYNYDAIIWSAEECIKHYENGKIKPHIGAIFKLDQINEAFAYIEQRKSTGKVVISMK